MYIVDLVLCNMPPVSTSTAETNICFNNVYPTSMGAFRGGFDVLTP